ncbi:MAG: carboxylesterase [Candidatus Hydrogenedentota bacterium]
MIEKGKRMALWSASGLIGALVLYNTGTSSAAHWADRHELRDPETGILVGAEPRNLGPEDSPFALLFIHGFVGAGNNFNTLPDQAAEAGWHVRVMRLPGHGTRASDLKSVEAADLRKAVEQEVLDLQSKHACVVLAGHSMGGALAVLTASGIPVDGLLLGAPYFGITHKWYYGLKPETWVRISSPCIRWVYKGKLFLQVNDKSAKDKIVSYRWIPSKASVTLNEIGGMVNEPEVLKKITCPVILFHATGDIAASYDAARHAFDSMPAKDKTFVDLPRSNHHVFWDFDKDVVARDSIGFLDRIRKTKETGKP